MTQVAQDRLKALEAAGGQVIRIDDLGQIDAALAQIAPTIRCDPPSPGSPRAGAALAGRRRGFPVQRGAEGLPRRRLAPAREQSVRGGAGHRFNAAGANRQVVRRSLDDLAGSGGWGVDAAGFEFASTARRRRTAGRAQALSSRSNLADGWTARVGSAVRGRRTRLRGSTVEQGRVQTGKPGPMGHHARPRGRFFGTRDLSTDGEDSRKPCAADVWSWTWATWSMPPECVLTVRMWVAFCGTRGDWNCRRLRAQRVRTGDRSIEHAGQRTDFAAGPRCLEQAEGARLAWPLSRERTEVRDGISRRRSAGPRPPATGNAISGGDQKLGGGAT